MAFPAAPRPTSQTTKRSTARAARWVSRCGPICRAWASAMGPIVGWNVSPETQQRTVAIPPASGVSSNVSSANFVMRMRNRGEPATDVLPFPYLLRLVKSVAHRSLNLPEHAPVMILPEATLFPHALLPLHIFEPRYRAMLAWTLERNRVFCVAKMKAGASEASSRHCFHETAGLGLVRACVQRPDGTSDLVLQG